MLCELKVEFFIFMKLSIEIICLMKIHKQDWMYKTLIYLNSLSRLCCLHQRQHMLRWNLNKLFVCAFVNFSTNVTTMHQNQWASSARHSALQSLKVVVNWFNKFNNSIYVGFSSPYLVNRKEGIKWSCFSTIEMELNPMTLEQ